MVRPVLGDPVTWEALKLRKQCRCAKCTNKDAPPPTPPPMQLSVFDIVPRGRYAVEITWTDGHKSLLPYKVLLRQ